MHKHTWTDGCQVPLALFNTEEHHQTPKAALKWLEEYLAREIKHPSICSKPVPQ